MTQISHVAAPVADPPSNETAAQTAPAVTPSLSANNQVNGRRNGQINGHVQGPASAPPMPAAPAAPKPASPAVAKPHAAPRPDLSPASGGGRTAARQEHDHRRAQIHSRLVSAFKLIFPVTALGVVVVFGVSIATNLVPDLELTLDSSLIEDGRVVMKNPKMKGVDKQNRRFEVIATRAITDVTNPQSVELEGIDAKVPLNADTFADVKADQGFYNNADEVLILRSNVQMSGARGMDIRLEDARINMKNGTLASDNPVAVTSDRTDISANAISVEDNGAKIVFTERVQMTIKRPVERGTTSATPSPVASSTSVSGDGANDKAKQ